MLDGGVGTISTNANLSFSGTPLTLTVNSSMNVDSNTLFVSASNNRVGIGTATPAASLEILSTSAQLQLSYNSTDNATFEVDDNGFLYITPSGGKTVIKNDLIIRDDVSNDTVVQLYDSSDDGVISGYANNSITTTIHANGATFFNGGNVGIGTNTPNTLLEISASTGTQLKLSNNTSSAVEFIVAANGNLTVTPTGSVIVDSGLTVNGNTILGDNSVDTVTFTGTNVTIPNGLNFNSNTLVLNQPNKRVGINKSNPVDALHVSGAFKAEQDGIYAFMSGSQFQISASSTFAGGGKSLLEVRSPTHENLFAVVEGGMISSNIVPAAFNANLYISGAAVLGAPATPIHNDNLHSGSVTFYLDEGNSKLFFRVRDSIGQVKSGSVNLS